MVKNSMDIASFATPIDNSGNQEQNSHQQSNKWNF
jgi:hypothetical protein